MAMTDEASDSASHGFQTADTALEPSPINASSQTIAKGVHQSAPQESHEDLEAYRQSRRSSRLSHRPVLEEEEEEEEESMTRSPNGAAKGHEGSHRVKLAEDQGTDRKHAGAPEALVQCSVKVKRWSERMEGWSQKQEDKAQKRRRARKEKDYGGTTVDSETGIVKEPKGDNVIQKKGIIPLVFIVLLWVYIVYVWRICTENIKQEERATASRAAGIGLLVAFNALWLMTVWAYVKVISTGPGLVRDHVGLSDAPPSSEGPEGMPDFESPGMPKGPGGSRPPPSAFKVHEDAEAGTGSAKVQAPLEENRGSMATQTLVTSSEQRTSPNSNTNDLHFGAKDDSARGTVAEGGEIDPSLPAVLGPLGAGALARAEETQRIKDDGEGQLGVGESKQTQTIRPSREVETRPEQDMPPGLPPPPSFPPGKLPEPVRMVPHTAPLDPANRYCYRCKRVKPPRAHHCRHCATCVLKMDHHCPWVGGCVGAGNHKFFYLFLMWVTLLEIFVMISTAVLFSRGLQKRSLGWKTDGYMISMFPITSFFTMFTSTLLITHTYLFFLNLTTIEHLAYDRMKTREEVLLSRYTEQLHNDKGKKLGLADRLREKKKVKVKWAQEWGSLKTEGNLWWLDKKGPATDSLEKEKGFDLEKGPETKPLSNKAIPWYSAIGPNWRAMMGERWYEWVLPIGRSPSDGLSYPTNWRFGKGGLWRKREDWSS